MTLVEVVLAMAILAAVAAGLAAALAASLRAGSAARERAIALAAADAQLQQAQVAVASGGDLAPGASRAFAVPGLSPVPGSSEAGLLLVTAWSGQIVRVTSTVRWRGSMGDDTIELTTLVPRK